MDILQTLLITLVIFSVLVIGYMLFAGSGVSKAQKRRMESLRYRHSESLDAKMESQFKRAVAARKPKSFKVAGSGSRTEALAVRLNRTGKGWSVSQYVYASVGLALGVAVAAEQQGLAVLAARHQHQHRLGLGEAAEVPEVAVLAVRVVGVVAAHPLGRGGQHQDRVLVGHPHQLLAAAGELGGLDHGGLS